MYGFQLLLGLGVSTMELTSSLHFILATILGIKNLGIDSTGHIIILMTAWLLLTSFKLISITVPCQSATTEAENTAVLVQKLLLVRHFDQETVTELRLFSQQLLQRKIKFTAFGFLSLDYSLLFAIFGGVTTYLVVAMQYDT
jgi:gustatory receptor